MMTKPSWKLDESTERTSRTHTLDIGPLQLRARDYCPCGCGNEPHWDLEVPDHGDLCESLDEAQTQAERVAREIYEALRVVYGDDSASLATARAGAALAERAACAEVARTSAALWRLFVEDAPSAQAAETMEWIAKHSAMIDDAIRARTTPATLSTDTLAAIAEARGLRLVEPELMAEVPVLRWECDLHSVARLGQWVLEADATKWTVWVDSPGPVARLLVAGATTPLTERTVNRRAAEDALRKLGVAFRTE